VARYGIRSAMNSRYLMLLVFTISTAACDPTVEGGGDTGGGGKAPPDLFACNLEVDCFLDYGHLGETITEEAVRCGGQLIASGEAGVEKTSSTPGPWPTTAESLYVVHGNGTLTMQTRSKCATDDGCAGQNTSQWGLTALQFCNVYFEPAKIEGCGDPQGICEWYPSGTDCVTVSDTWTCADLALPPDMPPTAVCTPGMDQTCNDKLSTSSIHGVCKPDGTCECPPQFPKNPATGRCQ
jgi:hypothetical protein